MCPRYVDSLIAGLQLTCTPLGHENLINIGILHRDISIGNVFISDGAPNAAGFLGDLDLAKVYDVDRLSGVIGRDHAQTLVKSTKSGSMTVGDSCAGYPFVYATHRELFNLWQ